MGTFPTFVLKDVRSALCIFTAAFLGRQDVAFLKEAGIKNVTVVDNNAERMKEMAAVYPGYGLVVADAFEALATYERNDKRFDLVTLDPWQQMDAKVQENVERFYRLARKWLVLGVGQPDHLKCHDFLMGKDVTLVMRNPTTGAMWLVIRRCRAS